jgi:hypothetical protein
MWSFSGEGEKREVAYESAALPIFVLMHAKAEEEKKWSPVIVKADGGEAPIIESANKSANHLLLIHRKSPKQMENRDQVV